MTSYIQGQRSVCPKPRIPFFWFTSIGVQKQPVLVSVSASTRLALQGSHVRRLYRKRTPLRSKSLTIKGLLYAQKIPLSSICNEEGPHYRLSKAQESCQLTSDKCHIWHGYVENPAAKHSKLGRPALLPWSEAQGSCHKTSNNQPYSRVWISLGDSIPGLYCVAWLTQESVSLRIFVKKKGMSPV